MNAKLFITTALTLLLPLWTLSAHDTGHDHPRTLPSVGPHGGKYAKMKRHYAEVVVRGNQVVIYILEPDVKVVAADATKVRAFLRIPGNRPVRLRLTKKKKQAGYRARIKIPSGARRVFFQVSCVLDGKRESGKVLYEPRR